MAHTADIPLPYSHSRRWKLIANGVWNALILLVALVIIATASTGVGAGGRLVRLLVPDVLLFALPAIPLSLLMASGELDLSLASIVGLASVVTAASMRDGGSLLGAAGQCLVIGLGVGLTHAALVGALRLNGALVTFASGSLLAGAALVLSDARGIAAQPANAEVNLLYMLAWGALLALLVGGIALIYFSPFGRRPGRSDPPEPLLQRTLMVGLPYLVGGMMAGLAGVVLTARLRFAGPAGNATYELRLLLAVVIGGTPLGRGISNALGALLGVVLTSALTLMLIETKISSTVINLVFGMWLVLAVLLIHGYHWLVGWMVSRRTALLPTSQATPQAPPEPPPAEKGGDAPAS